MESRASCLKVPKAGIQQMTVLVFWRGELVVFPVNFGSWPELPLFLVFEAELDTEKTDRISDVTVGKKIQSAEQSRAQCERREL